MVRKHIFLRACNTAYNNFEYINLDKRYEIKIGKIHPFSTSSYRYILRINKMYVQEVNKKYKEDLEAVVKILTTLNN